MFGFEEDVAGLEVVDVGATSQVSVAFSQPLANHLGSSVKDESDQKQHQCRQKQDAVVRAVYLGLGQFNSDVGGEGAHA